MSAICFSLEYFLVIFVIISIPDGNARYASGYNHPIPRFSLSIYIYTWIQGDFCAIAFLRTTFTLIIKNYFDHVGSQSYITRSFKYRRYLKKISEVDRRKFSQIFKSEESRSHIRVKWHYRFTKNFQKTIDRSTTPSCVKIRCQGR